MVFVYVLRSRENGKRYVGISARLEGKSSFRHLTRSETSWSHVSVLTGDSAARH
jgi:predicted GIY-YIG superfamily endonuclease